MAKPANPSEPTEKAREYLQRARRMLNEWCAIMARDGGDVAVRYSQDRHNEIENAMAQLLGLALDHNDRLKALEQAAAKGGKAKGSRT